MPFSSRPPQWQQQFEWDIHAPIALKAGIPQATLDALWSGATPPNLDPDQQALYDLCTELHRDRRVTPATRDRAVAALGEQGTMDAIGICGYYALLAMVLNRAPLIAELYCALPVRRVRTKAEIIYG